MKRKFLAVMATVVSCLTLMTACGSVESTAGTAQSVQVEVQRGGADDASAEISATVSETATPDAVDSTTVLETEVQEGGADTTVTAESIATMEVHFIDVGQGDATLIKNGDYTMLIDAAENDKGSAVQLYLQKQGVEKLDYLILTHTDSDHIGGADVIIEKFQVDTVFMGDYEKDTATYRDVIQALDSKGLTWRQPEVGSEYALGDATFTIIAPNASYNNPNDTSIGLILHKGERSFVFTGDAEAAEEDIVSNGINLDADVFKSGHHGSKTSSDEALLDAISPTYAVISCGEGNSYGFPHARTLNNLRARGVQVFRTDEQGSIVATCDGQEITWNCAPSETWQVGEASGSASSSASTTTSSKAEAGVSTTSSSGLKADTDESSTAISDSTQEQVSAGTTYICNTNTKKFHYPTCSSVKRMSDKNKWEVTTTREDLISQGYDPCGNCNP